MSNRRTFLKNISLLTLGGLASRQALAAPSNTLSTNASAPVSMGTNAKQMGLQTYSLGQELLKDLPNGLQRLAKMGFTELEIFGYREDTGKFGDYNPQNTLFISPKEYKKMADDAGLKITSSHLTPSVRDYIPENMSKFEDFWKKATDIHAELGCKYMVQPSLPRIENEDDAKRVCDVFNKAGEISVLLKISYENGDQQVQTREFSADLRAEEPPVFDDIPMEDLPEEGGGFSWLWAGLGAAGIAGAGAVFWLRLRKKKKEAGEAGGWEDWEQETEASGEEETR